MSDSMAGELQPPPRPVFARHAASVLLVRQAAGGPEVLMGVRAAAHRFMPNRLVFPGGAVDPADRTALAATEPRADVLDTLRRSVGPKLARAMVAAAARELHEETGLSFGIPPRLDGLRYICRAITPPRLPIRFNARFFVADAATTSGNGNYFSSQHVGHDTNLANAIQHCPATNAAFRSSARHRNRHCLSCASNHLVLS